MKEYAQISFDFTAVPSGEANTDPSVGVRVKSLKKTTEEEVKNSPASSPPESSAPESTSSETPSEISLPESTAPAATEPGKVGRGRKAQKTFAAEADLVKLPEDEQLFSKQYYTIGEVSAMFRVNPSLLRIWEAEFPVLQPKKNKKGDRHFRPADIKNLQLIYDLLRRRKLTIEGAREFMKKNKKSPERFEMIRSLQELKGFLQQLRAELHHDDAEEA